MKFKEDMMLVLSRKLGEKINIDGDIQVEVLEVCGHRVRLGISAPRDVRILRSECCFEILASHEGTLMASGTGSGI